MPLHQKMPMSQDVKRPCDRIRADGFQTCRASSLTHAAAAQVWRHRIGADPGSDALVYHEADESFYISLMQSRSKKLIFVDISAQPCTLLGKAAAVSCGRPTLLASCHGLTRACMDAQTS